jgi:hypothetical protein
MTLYPEQLMPEMVENLHLPFGLEVQIPKAAPVFRSWSGEFTGETYGNKPLLDVDGTPMFAELAILRLFQEDGWDGVWVDTFRKKYRTAWGEEGVVRLSGDRLQLVKAIHQRAGSASGCFDVFCWKDDSVVFAESKRRSKDEIRQTQLAWLEAAMQTGLDASAFLIVEWTSSGSPVHIRANSRTSTHRRIAPLGARGVEGSKTDTASPASASTSQEGYLVFYDAYDPDAHGKFLTWRERNLIGYVISRRSPSDAMIHQADCGHFEFGDESVSLTKTMKVCSASRRELEAWARENTKAGLRWCRSCM